MTIAANLKIMPRNFHDEAVLSVQFAEATGFPVQNTQNAVRDSVWRSPTLAPQYIRGVFPDDGRKIDFFGLFRHGCHGGTVQLELFDQPDWTSNVYDSTELDTVDLVTLGNFDWGTTPLGVVNDPFLSLSPFFLYFTAVGAKSYQITFRDTHVQVGTDYWQVGRVWLGKAFEVSINPEYGAEVGFTDNTERSRTRGGSLRTGLGAFWRSLNMDFSWIDESDRDTWMDICQYAMTGRDVVVSVFPGAGGRLERDQTINGKFVSLDALGRQVSYLTKRVVIEEV